MLSLQDATVAHFQPLLDQPFGVVGHDFSLQLVKAEGIRSENRPFRLHFAGPIEVPLEQQIVPLHHEAVGRLDIFLVPVDQTADHRLYEAIFN